MLKVIKPGRFIGWLAVLYVAANLRKSDRVEIYQLTGEQAWLPIMRTWHSSMAKWVIIKDNIPVGLFGVDANGKNLGFPWMVGTPEMEKIKEFIAKNSRKYISEMKKDFLYLYNWVDADNKVSIEWLKWCGFDICAPAPRGPFNHLFHFFEMRV